MPEPVEQALNDALVERLRADARVFGLVAGRIYDEAPAGVAFPYVRIFEIESAPFDSSNTVSDELTISIRCYARDSAVGGKGKVVARRVMGAIKAALHRNELLIVPVGWRVVEFLERTSVVRTENDIITRVGVAVYAALVEPV